MVALLLGLVGVAAPALAAAPASARTVTGQVTRSSDGAPVVGATVTVYGEDDFDEDDFDEDSDDSGIAHTTTGIDGGYSVTFDGDSSYVEVCVEQSGAAASRTLAQSCGEWDGSGPVDLEMDRATTLGGKLALASVGAARTGLSVELYQYFGRDGGWQPIDFADVSSTTGDYLLTEVPDGNYRLCVSSEDDEGALGCAGGGQVEDADDVAVRGTPVTKNFSIPARGHVRGTVAGPAGSSEISDGSVEAFRAVPDGRGGVRREYASYVDFEGSTYSIDLPAGRYRIRYDLYGDRSYLPVWNGSAATFAGATDIVVTSGGTVTANATAGLAGSITGTVTNDRTSGERYPDVSAVNRTTGASYYGDVEGGTYYIEGLPAGTYQVEFDRVAGAKQAAEFYAEKPETAGAAEATPVTVGTGQTRTGINNTLSAGKSAKGTLQAAGGTAIKGATVLAYTDDDHLVTRSAETSTTGTFSIPGLQVSGYKLAVDLDDDDEGDYFLDGAGALTTDRTAATERTVGTSGLTLGTLTVPAGTVARAPQPTTPPTITGTPTVGSTLTATPGQWNQTGLAYSYQWWRGDVDDQFGETDDEPVQGATGATYVPTSRDSGHPLYVEVRASKAGTAEGRADSDYTDGIGSAPRITSQDAPVLSDPEPVIGQPVTVSGGSWSVTPTSTSYQWYRNQTPIKGATTATYTPVASDETQKLSVIEVVQHSGNRPGTVEVTAEKPVPSADTKPALVSTAPPTITGAPEVGTTLTATPGTWKSSGLTYAYVWSADSTPIDGATSSTFTPTSAQVGQQLSVSVTASKAGYTGGTAASDKTAPVTLPPLSNTGRPTITGTTEVGQTLTTMSGTWSASGLTYAYQWSVGGDVLSGETGTTYVVRESDLGKTVVSRVTALQDGGATASAESDPVGPIAEGKILSTTKPTVVGTAKSGNVLTVNNGTWTPSTNLTFSHQWLRNGVEIAGATDAAYTVTNADAGSALSVKVSASRTAYTTAAATSSPTAKVQGVVANVTLPTISGTAGTGHTLTASSGTWDPSTGLTYAYVWRADGVAIAGATRSTFVPTSAQLRKRLTVTVTASRTGFDTKAATSVATQPVAATLVATARPTITGTRTYGQTLTASTGTWNQTGLTYRYQWFASGTAIPGATARTYLLHSTEIGKSMTVRVTAAKAGWLSGSTTAPGTAAVTPATFTNKALPVITGTAKVGYRLAASTGTWSPTGTYDYQWFIGSTPVSGATASTWVVTGNAAGKTVTVRVGVSRTGYARAYRYAVSTRAVAPVTATSTARPASPSPSPTPTS